MESRASAEVNNPIRVLVVDDSAYMRFTITRYLSEVQDIQVVGVARDGEEALEMIPRLNPQVVTLDVEMPRMDGLSTLQEIMRTQPRPVIMLSSLTKEGTQETVRALTLGAVDFVAKPESKANIQVVMDEVVQKIRRAVHVRVRSLPLAAWQEEDRRGQATSVKSTRPWRDGDVLVVIGASTGGPRALNALVSALPVDMPAALLIVQHMPAGFTRSLAQRLDTLAAFKIKEAAPGDRLEVGLGLLAPGGFHLTLDANGTVNLSQNPPVHGVRPAVDVTLLSVAQHFASRTVGVILTGMGNDGANGAALVHALGGYVIAEDESTAVVWGMPRSVIEAQAADAVLPLHAIPTAIEQQVRQRNGGGRGEPYGTP
ncbi:chemotaxis response regulator protein-glutamate methylesterase [uncultured Thermanaerothrix sp.]|uniref:protein-glutamate methylesterase/protein-glutamine glutaminase n=1 Tax=uncultured Thermanaerothrix sp. TaxID=1195149 RepID=UPI002617E51C|nr:chemotaxis response regulator protein-glutamate methylesterase [uncultured Thermanaerothrix sp.]